MGIKARVNISIDSSIFLVDTQSLSNNVGLKFHHFERHRVRCEVDSFVSQRVDVPHCTNRSNLNIPIFILILHM